MSHLQAQLVGVERLCDALTLWAERTPDTLAFRYLKADNVFEDVSYSDLFVRASAIAQTLSARLDEGERVLLPFRPGLDFVVSFLACHYAGLVPVPLAPLRDRDLKERLPRLIEDSGARLVLSHQAFAEPLARAGLSLPLLLVEEAEQGEKNGPPDRRRTDLAFLQYTSGSTGEPKAVQVSHANLLHNVHTITSAFQGWHAGISVSWLPPHHDMGLVGGVLTPILSGRSCWLMAPNDFVRAPLRWIEMVAESGADVSGGPNFAFDLCAQRILDNPEALPARTDLSAWRLAFCGAEPVRPATLRRFAAAFAPFGFDPKAFFPCYGLAEATLYVGGLHGSPPRLIRAFDAVSLRRGRARPADGNDEAPSRELVGCAGPRVPGGPSFHILSADGREVGEGEVGEIAISGASVATGYWRRPELSLTAFANGKLRTGDLGFIIEGVLYVTGRSKTLIIRNGLNYAAEDLELTLGAAAAGEGPPWPAAAFGVEDGEAERLVVLVEASRDARRDLDAAETGRILHKAMMEQHGLAPDHIAIVRPGALPRTTSGKIRRNECRRMFETGALDALRLEQRLPSPSAGDDDHDRRLEAVRMALAKTLQLPLQQINPNRPLGALGLDSLKTIKLQLTLEEVLQCALPAEWLHGSITLRQVLEELDDTGPERYWADAALAAGLRPATSDAEGESWLVTGANGLVGARVVAEILLVRPDAQVAGLVRPAAIAALEARLRELGVDEAGLARLRIIGGEMTAPALGLNEGDFASLASGLSHIVHCAAELSFVKPYVALRPINVEPCRAILSLMAQGCRKRLVHVSSASVLDMPLHAGKTVDEDVWLDCPEDLAVGYARSKWVADRLILNSVARGFDAIVVRPPWIVEDNGGDLGSGDFLPRFFKACAGMGAVPVGPFAWNVVTAGFVAQAIVALALQRDGCGPVAHLGLPQPVPSEALAPALRAAGSAVVACSVEAWLAKLEKAIEGDENHPLKPLASLFISRTGQRSLAAEYGAGGVPVLDSRRSLARLAELGVSPESPNLVALARCALGCQ